MIHEHGLFLMHNSIILSQQCLRKMIDNCLEQANRDGMSSIAFPAIGTGQQHYPHNKVASVMFQQIRHFSENTPNPSLCEIQIVLFEKNKNALDVNIVFRILVKLFYDLKCRTLNSLLILFLNMIFLIVICLGMGLNKFNYIKK